MMNTDTATADDSAARFAAIELDGPVHVAIPVVKYVDATSVRLQVAPEMKIVPGVSVLQSNVRRAKADEVEATRQGFSLKPPVYQLGRSVNEIGVRNFRAARQAWDAKPLLGEGCAKIIDIIAAEQRSDIQVDVPMLSMDVTGELVVPDAGRFQLTKRAIEGLSHFTTEAGGKYLSTIPAPLRAANFNAHFPLGFRVDKRASIKANPNPEAKEPVEGEEIYTPKRVTVRTRNNATSNTREAFSVVGPRYTAFDVNQVVSQVYNALVGRGLDARVDWTYDGYKLRMDVLFHTNVQPELCVAGEIFSAGLCIRTADDGTGSINVSVQLERNLCLNLLIIDHDSVLVGRARHSSKAKTIAEKIDEALSTAEQKISYFAKAWDAATLENTVERYSLGEPREVFRGLVMNGVVNVVGYDTDELVNKLMASYEKEPGFTKTAYVNAVTRMAHESEWADMDTVSDLESLGGELLFSKSWNCVPPQEKTINDVLGGF